MSEYVKDQNSNQDKKKKKAILQKCMMKKLTYTKFFISNFSRNNNINVGGYILQAYLLP